MLSWLLPSLSPQKFTVEFFLTTFVWCRRARKSSATSRHPLYWARRHHLVFNEAWLKVVVFWRWTRTCIRRWDGFWTMTSLASWTIWPFVRDMIHLVNTWHRSWNRTENRLQWLNWIRRNMWSYISIGATFVVLKLNFWACQRFACHQICKWSTKILHHQGFYELIPQHLLRPFDERELELIICGLGSIDVDDWKRNTKLKHCTSDSNIVKWFWKVVENFDEEQRAR